MKNKFALYFFLIVSSQLFAQNETYEVFNTSINSRFAELGISYLNDSTVIYASSKKTDNDKSFIADRRRNNRQLYVDLYKGKIKNGDIINEQKFTQEVDNKFYVSDISFTKDQKTVYFTWNNFYNTTSRKDSAKWKTLHIVKASVNENLELLSIEHLPFNSEDYSVRSPELSKDESQLFFTSDMPGGFGATDIYVVDIFEDGTYSEPRNLGANVNTRLPEMFPHSAENGDIYFSSYGHNSTGGLDIFKSTFNNAVFEKAEKLPAPINTKVDDFAFVINEKNNTGFFSSTRKKGKGDADIYSFVKFPEEINCVKEISGTILDANSKKQLSNTQVQLIANSEIVDEFTTGNDGFFNFSLDCDIEYSLNVKKQFYENSELSFTTDTSFENETIRNIELKPIDCSQQLTIEVVNSETNEFLNNASLSIFKNEEEIKLEQSATLKIDCNSIYKIIAKLEGFESQTISFSTSKEYDENVIKKITLIPVKCYQNFTGTFVDKLTQVELTNLKVSLIESDQIIDEVNLESYKLNFTLDCEKSYKIRVEKPNYKLEEFVISTTNELKKVIFETIELEPLECTQNINITVLDNFLNPLSGALIELYKNNEVIKTVESNNGESILEFDCENTYKIVVSKENYVSQEYGFTTTRQYDLGLKKQFELVKKDCTQTISGIVTNLENNEKLTNVKLSIFSGEKLIKTVFTDENASFSFKISCNNDYKITAEKTTFDTETYEFSSNAEFDNTLVKNFVLKPLLCEQQIIVNVINSATQEKLNEVNLALYEGDELLETKISTDNVEFNLTCERQYKIVASKENYFSKELVFNTNKIPENKLAETIELVEKECIQTLSGVVRNAENQSILPNAKVSLFSNNELIQTSFTNEIGAYKLQLTCNSTYAILVEKSDFQTLKYNDLTVNAEFNKTLTKDFTLKQLECNQTITLTLLNSTTKERLTKVNISLFENGKLLETKISTDNVKFNLTCEKQYKIIASKENYISKEIVFKSNNTHETELAETIELIEKECIQTLSGVVRNAEKKSVIPNAKISLISENELIQTSFTNENGAYSFQLNCNTNYSVLVEKDQFKSEELELKVNKEFNASILKNFNLMPLPCNQVISGNIVNDKNNESITDAVVKLFSNEKLIATTQSNSEGNYNFNIACKKTYKIEVQHPNYFSSQLTFSTNNLADNTVVENIKLSPKVCSQTMNIIIANEETNEPLNNLELILTKNDVVEESISLKTKNLILPIDCNSTYTLKASKENYETKQVEFTSNSEFYKKNSVIIKLKPLPCNQFISGSVFDRKLEKPIENATIEIYTNDNLISSYKSDTNGGFNIKLDCGLTYNIVIAAEGYLNDLKIINTTAQYNKKFNLDIYLNEKEVELFEEINAVKTVKMNPINFELNESKITASIAQELDKLIETLTKYPNLNLEVKNHTDSRAPDDYNLQLSEVRAQSIVNYIISNGISNDRVKGKGYGETLLLNKCSNGVKCTEAEHQLNRRTEFIVTERE